MIFGMVIAISLSISPVFSDSPAAAEAKAVLTYDGLLQGRLRFNSELIRLSIIAELDCGITEYVELCCRADFFGLGRMNLKGALREFYSSSALSAGSSVLSEKSGFSVTDSFSRTSRWGGFLLTETPAADVPGPDFWAFRTNSGEFSAGFIFDGITIIDLQLFMLETDLIVSAGTSDGDETDGWFSDRPLLPSQEVINLSGGLRTAVNPGRRGRRAMIPGSDSFSAAASASADFSFPKLTEPGESLRAFICAGSRSLYVCSFIETCSEDFISPSGEQPDKAFSWGGRAVAAGKGSLKTEFSGEYNYYQNHSGLLSGRVYEQEEEASLTMFLDSGIMRMKLEGEYCRDYDENGICNESAGAEFKLYGESDELRMGTEIKVTADPLYTASREFIMRMKTLIRFRAEIFEAKLTAQWNGSHSLNEIISDSTELGAEFQLRSDGYRLTADVFLEMEYLEEAEIPDELIGEMTPGFSITVETF